MHQKCCGHVKAVRLSLINLLFNQLICLADVNARNWIVLRERGYKSAHSEGPKGNPESAFKTVDKSYEGTIQSAAKAQTESHSGSG